MSSVLLCPQSCPHSTRCYIPPHPANASFQVPCLDSAQENLPLAVHNTRPSTHQRPAFDTLATFPGPSNRISQARQRTLEEPLMARTKCRSADNIEFPGFVVLRLLVLY